MTPPMDHHSRRRDTQSRTPVPDWTQNLVATIFATLAGIRRDRAIHTRGVTRSGTAHLYGPGGHALSPTPSTDVIVRFSRGAGLPAHLPDINGLAIRFLDPDGGHRDLLFATAGPGALRRVLAPSVDFATHRYSTIATYLLDEHRTVFTAELTGDRTTLDDLTTQATRHVHLTAHRDGRSEVIGAIELGPPIDSHIRYDPTATGPHLTPLGPINALRPHAYSASQSQPSN